MWLLENKRDFLNQKNEKLYPQSQITNCAIVLGRITAGSTIPCGIWPGLQGCDPKLKDFPIYMAYPTACCNSLFLFSNIHVNIAIYNWKQIVVNWIIIYQMVLKIFYNLILLERPQC